MSRSQRRLSAYHDGELRGLSRWWLELRLRRSIGLRRELAELEALSALLGELAEQEMTTGAALMAEVWPEIASRLAPVDARRRAEARSRVQGRAIGWSWLRWSTLAAGAVAASLLALAIAPQLAREGLPPAPGASGALRYLDTGGRPVMVSEGREDTTIIWLMDTPRDAP